MTDGNEVRDPASQRDPARQELLTAGLAPEIHDDVLMLRTPAAARGIDWISLVSVLKKAAELAPEIIALFKKFSGAETPVVPPTPARSDQVQPPAPPSASGPTAAMMNPSLAQAIPGSVDPATVLPSGRMETAPTPAQVAASEAKAKAETPKTEHPPKPDHHPKK